MKRAVALTLCALLTLATFHWGHTAPSASPQARPNQAAVERTRKTVKMLDDIYKNAIVLITDKYVKDKSDYPAGRAAKVLFRNISKTGSHEVRLVDVTGEPNSPDNVARDAFEKEGVKQLRSGKAYYESVVQKDGKPYLRAMTNVPVVMPRCVLCHENYANVKKGAAVGALSYTVPID
jgi:hypothetical protein